MNELKQRKPWWWYVIVVSGGGSARGGVSARGGAGALPMSDLQQLRDDAGRTGVPYKIELALIDIAEASEDSGHCMEHGHWPW